MRIIDQGWYIACTPIGIAHSMSLLESAKMAGRRYFFVVYTPPYYYLDVFNRQPGYDAVFMLPSDALAFDEQAWDVVLYDIGSHEAMAGIQWREMPPP